MSSNTNRCVLASSLLDDLPRGAAPCNGLEKICCLRCTGERAATGWKFYRATLFLAGKISRIVQSINEVPSSILTGTILNNSEPCSNASVSMMDVEEYLSTHGEWFLSCCANMRHLVAVDVVGTLF